MSGAASRRSAEQASRSHPRTTHPLTTRPRTAGAFGVPTVIAELLGLYGVVLVVIGVADRSHSAPGGAGGVSTNLWAGIAMLVVALLLAAWSLRRSRVAEPPREGLPVPEAPQDAGRGD